jgi:hypothetical protein
MFSSHVTKDISAYCHGELSSEESKQFAEHIISCSQCRSRFEEVKLGIKFAEQLPQLSAPDHLWSDVEGLLAKPAVTPARSSFFAPWQVKAAAAVIVALLVTIVGVRVYSDRKTSVSGKPYWRVKRLDGTPRIGTQQIAGNGQLAIGEWLETDGSSRAEIAVGSIGNVDIDANTRVRLLETRPTEHRLELARGKMSARIWAPPRLFFVDTPSAVAADLGCAYTLEVDDHGGSLLRVTSGWVALQLKDRESIVPAGAACETRPGLGPGTPYFEDSSLPFRKALKNIDFNNDAASRTEAVTSVLNEARPRDTLTLWHLLARVDGADRVRVYERMALLVPPPASVTRETVLRLDEQALQTWKQTLESSWINEYWKFKKGVLPKATEFKKEVLK